MSAAAPRASILYGAVAEEAPPDEQDVLEELHVVAGALERLGYKVEPLALGLNLEIARLQLSQWHPLFVFNLVESVAGRGRWITLAPTLLEELRLPYTGSPLTGIFLSSNKLLAKETLRASGIATPPWWIPAGNGRRAKQRGPWIVKSVWEHASIGLDDDSLVSDAEGLAAVIEGRRQRWGGEWFAERYIEGREFNFSLIAGGNGFEALPPAEILFDGFPPEKPRLVGYAAKWFADSFEYRHTRRSFAFAQTDLRLLKRLEKLALRCVALLQVRGYARVDFRVDERGEPWVLEVNANPCLSADGGFVAAARQGGVDFDEIIALIIEDVLSPTRNCCGRMRK
jgi:D-alanine-D-alanine ligase